MKPLTSDKVYFIDYVLGAIVAVYYSCKTFFSRDSRCPNSGNGIHLWVVCDDGYVCKNCGVPMTRAAPGT
ncbi:hypothetical protein KKE60_05315, partial [Patescibacteria group bacterium]|nr:hypothetical protein [Patescibacteria group bacterium]